MKQDNTLADPLTQRELDILRCIVQGLSNADIAERLVIAPGTVKWYAKQIYSKLDAHSREEVIAQAIKLELVLPQRQLSEQIPPKLRVINPLPLDVSGRYVGRQEILHQISDHFRERARLISIYGRAGSGKTALACQAISAVRLPSNPPLALDGIVCLSALSTGISLDRILSDVGRLLSESDATSLEAMTHSNDVSPTQKIGYLLERIAQHRLILLLDNLETLQDPHSGQLTDRVLQQFIEASLEQSSALTLLLTSREPLALPRPLKTWEYVISLEDGLDQEAAVALLRKFDPAGKAGLREASPQQLNEIADRLGRFPRALEAVAGMLLDDPLLHLDDLTRNIARLEGDVTAAIVQQALSRLGAEAMCVLQALAVFNAPVAYEALAFVIAPYMADSVLYTVVGRLIRGGFVKMNRDMQQLSIHPIDQAYCYQHIPAGTPADHAAQPPLFTRCTLHHRAAEYFRQRLLPRAEWQRMADLEPHLQEFKHRVSAGEYDEAARLLLAIDRDYLWEWGQRELLWQSYGMLKGHVQDARLAQQTARRRTWLKFFEAAEEADREFAEQLEIARYGADLQGEADALDDLAQTNRRNAKDLKRAYELHKQALAIYRQIGDRRGEAEALGGMAATIVHGNPEQAITLLQPATDLQQRLGNFNSLSFLFSMLGTAYENAGHFSQAVESLQQAIYYAERTNSFQGLVRATNNLAMTMLLWDKHQDAIAYSKEAVARAREFSGSQMTVVLLMSLTIMAFEMSMSGDLDGAIAVLRQAISDTKNPSLAYMGATRSLLSLLLLLRGSLQEARSLITSSSIPVSMYFLNVHVGVLFARCGEIEAAIRYFSGIMEQTFSPSNLAFAYVKALSQAGLGLLLNEPAKVIDAQRLYQQILTNSSPMSRTRLHLALVGQLMECPNGEILEPVRVILVAALGR